MRHILIDHQARQLAGLRIGQELPGGPISFHLVTHSLQQATQHFPHIVVIIDDSNNSLVLPVHIGIAPLTFGVRLGERLTQAHRSPSRT